jgi:hypothetical protein
VGPLTWCSETAKRLDSGAVYSASKFPPLLFLEVAPFLTAIASTVDNLNCLCTPKDKSESRLES